MTYFKFNFLKVLFGTLIIIFLFPSLTFAQAFNVTGIVTDETDNPIPFSTLEFIDSKGELAGKVESSYDGQYEIKVEPGVYVVRIIGPKESGIGSTEYENQVIKDETVLNYNLGFDQENSGAIISSNIHIVAVPILVCFFSLFGALFLYRRMKK